ncbi:hypothetical protein EDB19DRAFT_2022040 [Suillus lakei]|nr:hypothetical protein EDB19DRAFT_2022040 [Suillus lakei]
MFTRLSTAFVILFSLTALVNAGIPAARAAGDLDKRDNSARAADHVVLARAPEPEPTHACFSGKNSLNEASLYERVRADINASLAGTLFGFARTARPLPRSCVGSLGLQQSSTLRRAARTFFKHGPPSQSQATVIVSDLILPSPFPGI